MSSSDDTVSQIRGLVSNTLPVLREKGRTPNISYDSRIFLENLNKSTKYNIREDLRAEF